MFFLFFFLNIYYISIGDFIDWFRFNNEWLYFRTRGVA